MTAYIWNVNSYFSYHEYDSDIVHLKLNKWKQFIARSYKKELLNFYTNLLSFP